jgi:hypothetical protein
MDLPWLLIFLFILITMERSDKTFQKTVLLPKRPYTQFISDETRLHAPGLQSSNTTHLLHKPVTELHQLYISHN